MVGTDLKVVLLGREYAGKTSLLKRFADDSFAASAYQNTIGAAYASKEVQANNKKIVFNIWDTAGSERYLNLMLSTMSGKLKIHVPDQSLATNFTYDGLMNYNLNQYNTMSWLYYRGAKAAVICYDIGNFASWERVEYWINDLMAKGENCRIYICGTKKDMAENRQVAFNVARSHAEGNQATFYETSSKTGENVAELFQTIAEDFVARPDNLLRVEETITLSSRKNKRSCCSGQNRVV